MKDGNGDYIDDKKWLGSNTAKICDTKETLFSASASVANIAASCVRVSVGIFSVSGWITSYMAMPGETKCAGANSSMAGVRLAIKGVRSSINGCLNEIQASVAASDALSNDVVTLKTNIAALLNKV